MTTAPDIAAAHALEGLRPSDLTFLSPLGEVADWRMILLCAAAASTGVLTELPATADRVADRLGLDGHAVRVLLDALVGWGVVSRGSQGIYEQAAGAPGDEALSAIRHHARALRCWAGLERRVRGEDSGDPVGPPDPGSFHDSLAVTARVAAPEIVDLCLARFPGARRVLDLGGLHGEYALEFTRRGLRATMQDQPHVIEVVRQRGRLEEAGVELFEGSFFDSVPEGPFDLAFCSGITHTFDGDRNQTLYRNLRPVVSREGGVAVVTFLRNRNPLTALFAVQMLLNANGGDTHTEEEYRSWLSGAGFTPDGGVLDLPGRGGRSILFAT